MSTFWKQHWKSSFILKNHKKMTEASASVCLILATALRSFPECRHKENLTWGVCCLLFPFSTLNNFFRVPVLGMTGMTSCMSSVGVWIVVHQLIGELMQWSWDNVTKLTIDDSIITFLCAASKKLNLVIAPYKIIKRVTQTKHPINVTKSLWIKC